MKESTKRAILGAAFVLAGAIVGGFGILLMAEPGRPPFDLFRLDESVLAVAVGVGLALLGLYYLASDPPQGDGSPGSG